ncbi:MAG TPA: LysR family transcriptional regulator [Candidatus Dormibacteraeota bacterium]|nr:LysR family transcriptional regulator [Candidatus Dormibacteraeota bacterium]
MSKSDLWPRLELRHLLALDAIAREGSFWAAADVLDCSQSAVSQQVALLERIVGHRLVERSRGRREVTVTEAGRLLLNHAEAITAHLRALRADFAAYAEGEAGVLRVGSYQSVGQRIVPTLLREFTTAWPRVEVRLEERPADEELLDLVERGDLDLTFGIHPLRRGPFEAVELLRDPYVLVVPAAWPLGAGGRPFRVRDLRGVPLISYRSCHAVDAIESFVRSRGVQPNVVFRSDDNGTVQAAVAAGLGVALAPQLSLDPHGEGVRLIRTDELPWRTLVMVRHRDRYRSPASRAFEETAIAVCASMASAA